MVLKKEREYVKGPVPLDESWWAAVLKDAEEKHPDIQSNSTPSKGSAGAMADVVSAKEKSRAKDRPQGDEINWGRVKQLYKRDQVVCLEVADHNRGGLLVNGDDIQGFVPASHLVELSRESAKEDREKLLSSYVGRSLDLKVIECDRERGRIVFSERAAQAKPGKRLELLSSLCEGDQIHGRVTTITDFGVFVDLGGVEGLIHISELSWGRVCHPSAVLSLDDEIDVYILNIDRDRTRVALSLKRLHPNPWETVYNRYSVGQITKAVITNIVSFGAFARLEDGLDGLIHISEFGNSMTKEDIGNIVAEGQEVEVCILHIDSPQQRLGLSLHSAGEEDI
jgi:small subunit ribosomal protein S1